MSTSGKAVVTAGGKRRVGSGARADQVTCGQAYCPTGEADAIYFDCADPPSLCPGTIIDPADYQEADDCGECDEFHRLQACGESQPGDRFVSTSSVAANPGMGTVRHDGVCYEPLTDTMYTLTQARAMDGVVIRQGLEWLEDCQACDQALCQCPDTVAATYIVSLPAAEWSGQIAGDFWFTVRYAAQEVQVHQWEDTPGPCYWRGDDLVAGIRYSFDGGQTWDDWIEPTGSLYVELQRQLPGPPCPWLGTVYVAGIGNFAQKAGGDDPAGSYTSTQGGPWTVS